MENQLPAVTADIFSPANFEHAQRAAKALSASDLVPVQFKGNISNTLIAMDLSARIGMSPLMVMQHLYIVHGKPSWSSTFLIAAINNSGKFKSPLNFEVTGAGDSLSCVAWATSLTGDRLESPRVSMQMAKDEGWLSKAGSKWKTMPELMIRYRAAAFFSRLYAPEITMGMQTREEIIDVEAEIVPEIDPNEPVTLKRAETVTTPQAKEEKPADTLTMQNPE